MNLDYINIASQGQDKPYICSAKEAMSILKTQARSAIQGEYVFEALGFLEERFGAVMISPSAIFRKALATEDHTKREDLYFQAINLIETNIRNNYALRID